MFGMIIWLRESEVCRVLYLTLYAYSESLYIFFNLPPMRQVTFRIPACATVTELAEGTCLKNYEYLGSGEVYDKKNKKCTLALPDDSHLLLYLFCAFLEHPKWMLHVDPPSNAGAQSSKNPLFLGVLPPRERFPEKYISVISNAPSTLHHGALVLAVGKQSPTVFALYWDQKLQFSLQVGS